MSLEFVPIALACGHVLEGWAWFETPAVGSGEPSLVECPQGCGMVEYVVEPGENDPRPDQPPRLIEIDLGYIEAGDAVEIDVDEEHAE